MDVYFWIFAAMALAGGLFTVSYKDALPCALGLLTVFIALAALYLHMDAPLVAIFQVTIYAGAILVLVVFVIMLLIAPGDRMRMIQGNMSYRIMGGILGACLVALIAIGTRGVMTLVHQKALPNGFGDPGKFGDLFFRNYMLHFEVASVLLLVALVGAIYLTKKNL